MKRFFIVLSLAVITGLSHQLHAQQTTGGEGSSTSTADNGNIKKNLLKVNLTGLFVKNYSLQYERILTRKTSVALSFRTMPTSSVPFKGFFRDVTDNDPYTNQVIDNLRLSNIAITPEFRFYLGEGYGKGFYIAPFYRYAKFKSEDLVFEYDHGNTTESIVISGDQSSHTGGIQLGAQWFLGKSVALDWWILGPHYGTVNGNFSGITDRVLSQQEQNSLRQALEDVEVPIADKQITVTSRGADVKVTGGWLGLRAGLTVGIRF
ncbi:DUF3575 domain-containing protein [Terrimonas sp. NA20]|uniref:DUF3575 domain-containing protein n=1 Tax=Terrimonas ginsenosidimutans TaxID=2908004 RepID=A0ABS9KTB1_9BACT|nr:DUF3575 domain-containing protein [Terrimonas ginsenosidimutans]MCG2615527.1 DUF3575 domain-containing protein [Terrimonas ginsenosidimutans]